MNQVVTELNVTAKDGANAEGFSLSSRAQQTPLLAKADELRSYESMQQQALLQLALMTEHEQLLGDLRQVVEEIDEEAKRYESASSERLHAEQLNLIGLIDELELLHYLDDQERIAKRQRRLQRRLYEWNPPRYMVQRAIENLLASHYQNPSCDKLRRSKRLLQRSQRRYQHQRNKLTQANLRLVFSVANRYRNLNQPYEDLVQEGSIGLIKAIERFEHKKGFLFSTYAYRVISQAIHLAVERNEHLVRRPYKQMREKATVDQTRIKLEQKLGRSLRGHELAEQLGDGLEHKKAHVENNTQATASAMPGPSSDIDEYEHAALESEAQQFETLSLSYKQMLSEAIEQLDPRSARILRLRYGIGVNQNYTLKEISQRLSLSSERVRQIAQQAVKQIQENLGELH